MHRNFYRWSGPVAGGSRRRAGRRIERPLLEIVRRSIKALHRKGPLRNRAESRRVGVGVGGGVGDSVGSGARAVQEGVHREGRFRWRVGVRRSSQPETAMNVEAVPRPPRLSPDR
ncbi:hypothetical protein BSLA_02f1816 [Burkholderia stabilis]|nr:hypothetical protein BSLA_02f1816 [Burkholderia stabilis]